MSIFVRAVELGSFSAAADALGVSPQLVGKNVLALENHLGVKLLNRTTRRHHLTEIGKLYFERSQNILAEVEAADALAEQTRIVPRGKLRISAPVTFGIHILAPKIPDFLRMFPDVSVDLSLSNRLIDVIEEGYDAVFRVGELEDSGLIARRLNPYRLLICASPDYLRRYGEPKTPSDLANHECLIFSHTGLRTHWSFDGPGGNTTVPISGRLMMDSGEALLAAAMAGHGIILQPVELLRASISSGDLLPLLPGYEVPTRPLHILHAPDRRITPKLRSFLDFAAAEFGDTKT
jgi:DNA-binding transcriptional LysR family regulator